MVTKPKIDTSDWRNLPVESWNVRTVQAYFTDMNREMYGVETYLPMRTWGFEQGAIKQALAKYGAATLKAACDIAFAEYRPTREFPILTAGFAISYRINAIIPRLQADERRREAREAAVQNGGMTADELAEWI